MLSLQRAAISARATGERPPITERYLRKRCSRLRLFSPHTVRPSPHANTSAPQPPMLSAIYTSEQSIVVTPMLRIFRAAFRPRPKPLSFFRSIISPIGGNTASIMVVPIMLLSNSKFISHSLLTAQPILSATFNRRAALRSHSNLRTNLPQIPLIVYYSIFPSKMKDIKRSLSKSNTRAPERRLPPSGRSVHYEITCR